ncbi:MAG: TIGR04283 family arsenosugar biosynthesis glycosyltransferase [Bacteroidia bacterium]|nr:TIGR04283 family arsenosugar biosynthesis glycosyltransferase [Bacteroidia bacterium]NND25380.1 glycosyltransferase family 2 protein [Flavobacteriaceae bacterium]MBT8279572.1 TIGR04283 family arsenosugar biosynthesis glycosyltransferase [Bacteroidia bacterium]NNK60283.1 glycosyltransferase family 2 protein [Flavobacteriaceae bacterium]NNL34091.1 glycosyltransferase family 2 protein [Flavobacteriaceae bacterium]
MSKISIIIPMLNEAETISKLLDHLLENSSPNNIKDLIVVDGGSEDNSRSIVSSYPNVTLIISERGRAKQMNAGANIATGNIFYFLHADSFPPKHFDRFIIEEVSKGNMAGCFRMQFDHKHWWLRLAGWLTQFRWRACRGGDQSQFISKQLFEALDGFDENYTIYEDNDLINKLYAKNEFTVIQQRLTTSARCYRKNGVWRLQYHFWAIYVRKWLGATPKELQSYYAQHIK